MYLDLPDTELRSLECSLHSGPGDVKAPIHANQVGQPLLSGDPSNMALV